MTNISDLWALVKTLSYAFFVYLDIDIDIFRILAIFLLIDTVSGTLKVLRWNKEEFRFKKLMWGMITKIGILIIPLAVALLGKGMQYDLSFGVDITIKVLILSELFSSAGNFYTLRTGIVVNDIDFISMGLLAIRKGSKKQIDKLMKVIENAGGCTTKENPKDDE